MMRILMLDNEFPPLGGGMGTTNEALLWQFMHRSDMEIDLITSALGSQSEEVQFAERIHFYKVPVHNKNIHHSSNRELITYAIQAWRLALKLHRLHPYDFCFAWSALPAGVVAWALRSHVKLMYMIWASGPDIPGFERRYRWIYPLLRPILQATWRRATPLIAKCVEEIEMIHAVDRTIPVTMVPNGVDLLTFRPGLPIPDDGPLKVICVARLIERKGQHHLIEAVKRLADDGLDVTLDLVGTGDSLTDYQMLARRLDVGDRVHFVGYISREEIPAYYAASHVFVLPSFNEGMSLAALEAMGAGLPLVVTRTGGTRDLLEEGVNGFAFDWADVGMLAAHLHRLATDRALARQMGAASRVRAQRFSWETIAAIYLQLFASRLSRKD